MQNSQGKVKVILMPGLNGTDGLFQDFIKKSPEHFQPTALSYPTNKALTYEELTEWVCERLSAESEPMVLVGESFSGPLSLFVANKFPEKVIAVVLVASFVSPPRPALLKILPWSLGFALTKPLYALRTILTGNSKTTSIIKAISTEMQRVHPKVLAHRVRQTLSVNAASALAECKLPILYMQAASDIVVPKSALIKILCIKSSVQVAVFPTQHFLLQSAPHEAWLAISEFVGSLPPNKSLKPTASTGAASQVSPGFGSLRAARFGGGLARR